MQLGWCTLKCHFSQEIGVGDTWTSFSYDGGRVRKWNVQNSKYGDVSTAWIIAIEFLPMNLVLVSRRYHLMFNRLR